MIILKERVVKVMEILLMRSKKMKRNGMMKIFKRSCDFTIEYKKVSLQAEFIEMVSTYFLNLILIIHC